MPALKPMRPPLTQQGELLIDWMEANQDKDMTPWVARVQLGLVALIPRIAELRKAGFGIVGHWETDKFNRRYMVYRLGEEQADE